MGWIKEPIRDSREIFNEIVSKGWNGSYKGSTCPYEYFSDYIRDYYDVTLKQCDEICRMIKEHYGVKEFFYTEMKCYKAEKR